ncbi:hypothetical protein [Yersinia pseudotuberculosis]|uniref:hypothetical protein n=1 Tax=Yersinia pseudotuberculosis TaxID=633 RepID=UPI002573D044|nr:hypothetical protein [Yersinia pseudotuberculosis]
MSVLASAPAAGAPFSSVRTLSTCQAHLLPSSASVCAGVNARPASAGLSCSLFITLLAIRPLNITQEIMRTRPGQQ